MTFKELQDFIENKMRMSHIYQPLLIKTLVEAEGITTTRKLALEFLKMDESQIQHKVLTALLLFYLWSQDFWSVAYLYDELLRANALYFDIVSP